MGKGGKIATAVWLALAALIAASGTQLAHGDSSAPAAFDEPPPIADGYESFDPPAEYDGTGGGWEQRGGKGDHLRVEDASWDALRAEVLSLSERLQTSESEKEALRRDVDAWAAGAKVASDKEEQLRKKVKDLSGRLEKAVEDNRRAEERAKALESHIEDLQRSVSTVAALERSAAEQTSLVSRLQAELRDLKAKEAGTMDELEKYEAAVRRAEAAELQVGEASALLEVLKGQVKDLEMKVEVTERSLNSQSAHSEHLSSTAEDTRRKLAEVEQTLKIAEAAMLAAEAEAAAKGKALLQTYRQWLPPWAAVRLAQFQTKSSIMWAEHGKPAVADAHTKLRTQVSAVHEWAKPHLSSSAVALSKAATYFGQAAEPAMEFAKEQHARLWPVVYGKWASMVQTVGPHVEVARVKLNEIKASTRAFVKPHLQTARTVSEPYIELLRVKCKPAVDVVIDHVGPHVEVARKHMDPHMQSAVALYHRSVAGTKDLHQQVAGKIRKHMLSYELTAPYALDNIVWFLAAALFLLPLAGFWIITTPYRRSVPKATRIKSHANVTHRHRKHNRRTSNPARTSSS